MPGGSVPECAPLRRPSYLPISGHNAVARGTFYGSTRKGTLLESVPLGVTTWTVPVVAPVGTVVVIRVGETTAKAAAGVVKVTEIAPVRLVPKIMTADPSLPAAGCVFTNGPRPIRGAFAERKPLPKCQAFRYFHLYLRKSTGHLRLYLGPVVPCSAIESRRMLSVLCCEGNGRGSNVRGLPLNLCCLFVRGLVEGHLLIAIRRSAHVPRICMEESVVAKAVPKRPRYGLDIAQRARLRLRNGLEFIVLVLAGNKVGRHPPPSPRIVRQILAELGAQGDAAIPPIGVLLTVLRRGHKEPAIQRNQPVGEEFQATRHRRLIDASRAEHDVATQYKRIKLLHGVQRKAITRKATKRAGRRVTAIAWRNIIVPESNFRDLVLLIALELLDRRLEQELTV